MKLERAIAQLRGEQHNMQSVEVGEAINIVLATLAEREAEHQAWEAMRNGIVWNVWKHDQTGVWSANRDDDIPARNWQADNPVDAVLAAKAAEEKGPNDG